MNIPIDAFPVGIAGVAARLAQGPRIDPSAFVAPGATVVGDVTVGEKSSVWSGAVLRGDINRIIIGPCSNVQDGVIIHLADEFAAVVGEFVTIGHGAIVHACTLGDEVLVGMGATIMDGSEIGGRSIIGANTLVTAGMKIPPGSLVVGSPGRIVRSLNLDEQIRIKSWALKYVELARLYRNTYASP